MSHRTPAQRRRIRRKIGRQRNKRALARLRGADFTMVVSWIPLRWHKSVEIEAQRLSVHRQTVLRAAIEVGLRHLTPSDVLRTEQTWRGMFGRPFSSRDLRLTKEETPCDIAATG